MRFVLLWTSGVCATNSESKKRPEGLFLSGGEGGMDPLHVIKETIRNFTAWYVCWGLIRTSSSVTIKRTFHKICFEEIFNSCKMEFRRIVESDCSEDFEATNLIGFLSLIWSSHSLNFYGGVFLCRIRLGLKNFGYTWIWGRILI